MRKDNKDLLNYKQQDAHEFWLRLMTAMENKRNCYIFPNLFEHIIVTNVRCGHCHNDSQTKQKCDGLVLDFNGRPTIREALDAYFDEEIVENFFCENCTKTVRRYELTKI